MKRLHIVGSSRSGTTLMMELLATCFESDGFCQHEMSILKDPETVGDIYFSKKPSDIKYIKPIFKADNNLFVIYMIRDPRDVLASIHESRKPGAYFSNFKKWKKSDDCAKQLTGHSRFVLIRYEDLVTAPNAMQEKIMNTFPFLRKIHDFSDYESHSKPSQQTIGAMNGLRPVSPDRIGNWKNHKPRIKGQLLTFPELSEALIYHGYEKDKSWCESLANVEPDFSSTNERKLIVNQWRIAIKIWLRIKSKLNRLRLSH